MKYRVKSIGAAALLLCVSLASDALTLGSLRGAVIIGRPLEVSIPVQVEQKDNTAASCFEAEVFHADVRQPAARVRVVVEPGSDASSVHVRVLSSTRVNEPVVSIHLRTLCGLKIERRYTLLADLPTDADVASLPPIDVDFAASPSTVDPQPRSITPDKPQAQPLREVRAKAIRSKKEGAASTTKTAERVSPQGMPSGQSRLQLDSLELFSDRLSLLDEEHPDAVVDTIPPDPQKVLGLEGTVASLQALVAQNEARLRDLNAQLKQSQAERLPAWRVLVVASLVVGAVAGMAVLWRRQRRGSVRDEAWWSATVMPDLTTPPLAGSTRSPPLDPTPPFRAQRESALDEAVTLPPVTHWPDSRSYGVDVNEVEMGVSRFNRYIQTGQVEKSSGVHSAIAPLDLIKPESERLDAAMIAELRQQAEFFVALGQTDQAVIVLEKLIHDSDVPDPNVFLDLLALLHSLRKKVEFQRCREAFNLSFNGVVSEFVRFKSEGRSLEDYPATLADIVGHWASPDALESIHAYVVRRPHPTPGAALDLAAFRDLLLLQAIAQQLKAEEGETQSESHARQSQGMPWVEMPVAEPGEPEPEPELSMMALDLDLSVAADEADTGYDGLRPGRESSATWAADSDSESLPFVSTPVEHLIDFDRDARQTSPLRAQKIARTP